MIEPDPALRPSPAHSSPVPYEGAFPNSARVFADGPGGLRVPMREIALSGGEPSLRVYDTSGPGGRDVRHGLPLLRDAWIRARDVRSTGRSAAVIRGPRDDAVELPPTLVRETRRGDGPVTQMHYARRGEITPEMAFIAVR
ncbi:MAG: phosphomethylpyrimidine synthase ThiC, partial [Gemmatimonadales bacterium]|nr:phosphomethylpyrimidine synthase ThiC [Gemmatimonadales bacterium]